MNNESDAHETGEQSFILDAFKNLSSSCVPDAH